MLSPTFFINVFYLDLFCIHVFVDDVIEKKCNCKNKSVCPLDGNCKQNDVIYKCIASTSVNPDKVYLGTAEGEFKKRYCNHNKPFRHRSYANETTLSKYVLEMKDKYNEMPS